MSDRTRSILSWAVWWSAVFTANAALPLGFGLSTSNDVVRAGHGQFGVWAGAWVVWAGWLVAGAWSARLRALLIVGGTVVALTQIVPVLQILAAAAGDVMAGLTLGWRKPSSLGVAEARGFVASVTTGQLVVGLVLAVGFRLAPRPHRPGRRRVAVLVRHRPAGTSHRPSRAGPRPADTSHPPLVGDGRSSDSRRPADQHLPSDYRAVGPVSRVEVAGRPTVEIHKE
jgi:hypothetical protein